MYLLFMYLRFVLYDVLYKPMSAINPYILYLCDIEQNSNWL